MILKVHSASRKSSSTWSATVLILGSSGSSDDETWSMIGQIITKKFWGDTFSENRTGMGSNLERNVVECGQDFLCWVGRGAPRDVPKDDCEGEWGPLQETALFALQNPDPTIKSIFLFWCRYKWLILIYRYRQLRHPHQLPSASRLNPAFSKKKKRGRMRWRNKQGHSHSHPH